MVSINYKPGIKKILSDMPGNVTIARSGNDLLNRLLLNLNSKLINKSLDIASGTSNVLATHAVNAVDALFVGNLKGLAFAEGDKILNLYSSGRIEYKPEKKTFKRKKKKSKKALIVAAKEFTKGVSDLKSLIFPQASLPSQTTTILCEMLEKMAVNISNFIQAKGKDCIKQDDVKDAVVNLLPDLMSKHAIAEGTKMTNSYETKRREKFGRKIKRTSATASLEFARGVSYLTSLMFPQVSIPVQATEMICKMLEEMAVNISEFVHTKAKNCIKVEDVRDAIVNLLPEHMSHHAIAEGTRMTFLYDAGSLKEFRRTHRTKDRSARTTQKSTSSTTKKTQKRKRESMESPETHKSTRTSASTQRPKRRRVTAIKQRPKIKTRRRPERLKSRRSTKRTKKSKARTRRRTQRPKSRTVESTQKRKRKITEGPEEAYSTPSGSIQKTKRRRATPRKQSSKIRTRESSAKRKSRRSTERTKKSKARTRRRTQKPKSRTVERTQKRKRKLAEGPEEAYSTPSGSIQKTKRRRATPRKQSSKIKTRESSAKRKSRRSTERTKKSKARTRRRTQKPKSRTVERTRKRKLSEGPEETYSTPSGSIQRPKRRTAMSRKQSSKIRRESSAKRKSRKSEARARKPKAQTTVGTQRHKKRKISAISPLDLARGVSKLTSVIFPKASLQAKSKEIICEMLADMALKISHFVQSKEGKSIKLKNVRSAIVNLLTGPMSGPAITEGARMTFLYETKSR